MTQFKKVRDFWRDPVDCGETIKKSRFMSFQGARYTVSLEFTLFFQNEEKNPLAVRRPPKKNYYMSISINHGSEEQRFLPYIAVLSEDVGPNYLPEKLCIQTTSFGTLPISQFEQMVESMRLALEDAKEIERVFVEPIRNGGFNCDGLPEGEHF